MAKHEFWLSSDLNAIQDAIDIIDTPIGLVDVLYVDGDVDFVLLAVNKKIDEFYQTQFSRFVGKSREDALQEADPETLEAIDRIRKNYLKCLELGNTYEYELAITEPVKFWSKNTLTPVFKGDLVRRILITIVDQNYRWDMEQVTRPSTESSVHVCAWCDSMMRDSEDEPWENASKYLHRCGVNVSHGVCHQCMDQFEDLKSN